MRWFGLSIILFLLLGAFFIVSNENLYLLKREDFSKFYSLYYQWLINIFSNIVSVTGHVVKFHWLPNSNNTAIE